MYVYIAPRTFVKAVLNVSSTGCNNNERNLNAHFFSVFLFVYALQVSKALSVKGVILCKFS